MSRVGTNELPSHASVVVIGGGIMGCSTLYHLAKSGISDAILLERNQLTSGTTWHSAAQVRALRSTRNLTDLIRYSIDLYTRLEAETGQHTGWINKGSLSIATCEDRLINLNRQAELAKLFGVRAQSISVNEAKERWPHMQCDDVVGAVWSPDDGRVSPSDLCAALVKGAQSQGARLFENTGVVGIITQHGQVRAIETSRGQILCDAIAICTGLWSREVGHMADVNVPVWPCEHFYLLTKPIEGITGNLPTLSDHDSHLYIRDDSGGLLVGCFEPVGKPINPETIGHEFAFQLLSEDWDHFEPMMRNALHRIPALASAEVNMLLNGPESFTPDGSFLLGETSETRGLFLGCGMNSVGVATSGGAGMALAHLIENGYLPMDLHEANPQRFPAQFNSVGFLTNRVPEVLGRHYELSYPGRQWSSCRNLRTTPLHDHFVSENAYFGQFYGWERPLYFERKSFPRLTFGKPDWFDQVAREVHRAHHQAALFDLSTFGKIDVFGAGASRFLNRVCANQVDRPVGRVLYTTMLNERGGVESDLTVLRLGVECFRLYVGTQFLEKNLAWLARHRQFDKDVELKNVTQKFAVIALMGPESTKIAMAAGAEALTRLKYFDSVMTSIAGCPITAVRLSYVGESGWEITCRSEHVMSIYATLCALGASSAGLFAQTSMRIEKRFLAYGHELDSQISPLEAGLGFTVDWNKEFIGKRALENQRNAGVKSRIVSILFDDCEAVPLGDEPVLMKGRFVGKTTSAAYGYRIDAPIALAMIDSEAKLNHGVTVEVSIAGEMFKGRIARSAVFDPTGSRMKSG